MSVVTVDPADLDDPFADRRLLVLIASYRDPELPRTIANALAQAAYPEHVRFAICHQFDESTVELLDPWRDDPRFAIDEIPHTESRGCCWARARTFEAYDDEPYILQIDAHTRFAARWDARYIDMLESLDSDEPVLSTYPPPYQVGEDDEERYDTDGGIQRLELAMLRYDLTTTFRTVVVEDTTRPSPSKFLAAGQIFARGSFCRNVPYDPDIYFNGEEISLAVRAFTHGYDFYSPSENLIWHRYNHGQVLHWDDHSDHDESHRVALDRLETLLLGDASSLGRFGLGSTRTLADYEQYAEIDFAGSRSSTGWRVEGRLELDVSDIDFETSYSAWIFAVFADNAKEIWRDDIVDSAVLTGERRTIELDSPVLDGKPASYIVWPAFADGELGERREFPLDPSLIVPPAPDGDGPRPSASPPTRPDVEGSSVTISIDRSVIEPRDDYRAFVVAFFDADGNEVSRVDVVRPDVLDLSVGEVTFHELGDALSDARTYVVVPTRSDGSVGSLIHRPLVP